MKIQQIIVIGTCKYKPQFEATGGRIFELKLPVRDYTPSFLQKRVGIFSRGHGSTIIIEIAWEIQSTSVTSWAEPRLDST